MRLARFSSVRGRLLALLVAIAFPIACLTAITAVSTYRSVTSAIERAQERAAEDFAIRIRVWYRGAARSLDSWSAMAAHSRDLTGECGVVDARMLRQVRGYLAFLIQMPDGGACQGSVVPGVQPADLVRVSSELKARPASLAASATRDGSMRYDYVTVGGRSFVAVQTRGGPSSDALLLADSSLLDQVFDLGDASESMNAALVSQDGAVVSSRGPQGDDAGWLPAADASAPPETRQRWWGQSRKGEERSYVTRPVSPPGFHVVVSFDGKPERAALVQFLVLLLAPLATLALLCIVYLRAIDQHCVRWLRSIEHTARARLAEPTARVALAEEMPADIRSVAEAFNTMVEEQEARQRKLQTALDDNRFLVRELHHRVKNSLQVVQSYIGLSKRSYRDEARIALADAECRVHVLSAAYRFTLADGEMQPVRVDLFLEDVVTMIANLIARRGQSVTGRFETKAQLSVDRIIPLGFLLVDLSSRVLRQVPDLGIVMSVVDLDPSTIEVSLETDLAVENSEPPRLFAGLLAQIEIVEARPAEGRVLGRWRIRHSA
ncbi:MAG: hypothetical protein DI527_04930 [Chelatococcus sp.]|nr:MAG: hypothetical protein DI527_04930 [Chelatococcus sp.]